MTIMRDELPTADFLDLATGETIPPTTPGDVLRADFIEPRGLTPHALAKATRIPAKRITAILRGTRAVTADTALRLAAYFGTSAEMWMTLQMKHDLAVARTKAALVAAEPGSFDAGNPA